jgi:DNA-binding transcriptional ArsR family regulator
MDALLKSIKALSEEIRIRIVLLLLEEEEACVCELMDVFDMAQSKLSHHLITLRDAGFLQDEKRGKWNYYRINKQSLSATNQQLLDLLNSCLADNSSVERDRRKLQPHRCRTVVIR